MAKGQKLPRAHSTANHTLPLLWCVEANQGGKRLEDADLLQLFCERSDTLAFAQLVQRYSQLVWRVCYQVLGHYQDAEDAFQATFLVLATQASRIRKPEQLGDWLHGVALRISWKARIMRRRRKLRETQAARCTEATVAPGVSDADSQALIHRELARLPAHYRTVLVLCDLQALSRREAAKKLGIAEGTVASRLARGRQLLARRLRRAGWAVATGVFLAPVQDLLASFQPKLIPTTLELVHAVLSGHADHLAKTPAYLLANQVLRSLAMARVGMWAAIITVIVSAITAGALGLARIYASGAPSASTSLEALPPANGEGTATTSRASSSGGILNAAHNQAPAHIPVTDQEETPPAQKNDQDAAEPSNNREVQVAQAGPGGDKAPHAPKVADRPTDRWSHRRNWENVEVPVAVAIAPTGDYFAVADGYGYVKLYKFQEDKPQTVREPRKAPREPPQAPAPPGAAPLFNAPVKYVSREERIWDIAFSKSGTLLAVACGMRQQSPRVEVFSLQRKGDKDEWRLDQVIPLEAKYEPRRVAFTPDGKALIVGGFGRVLASYEVGSGKPLRDWAGLLPRKELGEIRDLQVSSSGKYLAVTVLWQPSVRNLGKPGGRAGIGGIGNVGGGFEQPFSTSLVLLDLEKGERRWFQDSQGKISPVKGQLAVFERVAISQDESLLACTRMDAQAVVFDLPSGKKLQQFDAGESPGNPQAPGFFAPGIGGGGFGPGPMPRSVGGSFSPDYWTLTTTTPLVFFDPATDRLVTWDFLLPGLGGAPRLWDVKSGKAIGQWDVSLTLRMAIGGTVAPITTGVLGGQTGRFLITVEPQPAGGVLGGGGFLGGGIVGVPGQPGQTEEEMVHGFPAVIRLYAREDSLK